MIEVSHLTRQYGDLTAVHDMSFVIGRGELVSTKTLAMPGHLLRYRSPYRLTNPLEVFRTCQWLDRALEVKNGPFDNFQDTSSPRITNNTFSPSLTPKRSRIASGIVTWPFRVIVDSNIPTSITLVLRFELSTTL